jgi:hypothetical protein
LGHFYGKGRPIDYPYDSVSRTGTPQLSYESYMAQLDDYGDDPRWNEGPGAVEAMNDQRLAWADPDRTAVDDPVCWNGWQQIQAFSYEALGFLAPLAMTEGGWVPRDRAGSDPTDIRWPYTTPNKVAQQTLAAYGLNELIRPMFAVCPWLLADGAMNGGADVGWPYDAWVGWAYSDKYGMEKPVVQMLKENPPL